MKVYIDEDERWPDWDVTANREYEYYREVEITETEWQDWLRVKAAYDAWCEKWATLDDANR